jgi:lipopolysaccharide/colanic/teichoic acid biosynthesis glycosyltransferase
MNISNKREATVLFLGDIVLFIFGLWLALIVRYSAFPSAAVFESHFSPFAILFAVWLLVFFVTGLYEKHTTVFKSRLPLVIINAEIINAAIGVIFFYFIPYFGIAPKTILFLDLVITTILIVLWRLYGVRLTQGRKKDKAILIGSGNEVRELQEEVNGNSRYSFTFVSSIDPLSLENNVMEEKLLGLIYGSDISIIVIDLKNEKMSPSMLHFYNLIFSGIQFVDMHRMYEEVFDRIPLSLLTYSWFLENISVSPKPFYDFMKRGMDIILSGIIAIVSLIFYPFVIAAIKFDDGGPVFFYQKRVGKNNGIIQIIKFRSMGIDDAGKHAVTRIGKILRKSRIDELPQLWNVLKGDISLIGPRPEIPELVNLYQKQIPYYNVRHLIKPGLSGWAQMYHQQHPHHAADIDETKNKLSYDIYYIKNRSLLLDLRIALRTIKVLFSLVGV